MKKKNNEKKGIIILFVATIVVLYMSLKDNFKEVVIGFTKLNPFWILISIIFVFGYYYFKSLSLYCLARKFKSDINFFKILKIVLITQFFDGVTPSATGGQPYQIYAFNKEKIDVIDSTNIAIQNFIVYQIALILLGLLAVISNSYLNLFSSVGSIRNLIILGFIINVVVVISLFSLAFMKKINKKIIILGVNLLSKLKIIKNKSEVIKNTNSYIEQFHKGALTLLSNKGDFVKTIVYNFVGLVLIYVVPSIIIFGLGLYQDINVFYSIIASAYVMLIGAFVPIPGGTGGLEYAFVKFYGVFVGGSTLMLVMLLWRFLTYYLGVIVGSFLLNIRKK